MRRRLVRCPVFLRAVEPLFLAGAAGPDIDGRKDMRFGKRALKDDFAVAGALEFFKNQLIHAGARIHKGRGDDGDRAAVFDIARKAEEAARQLKGSGIQPAGQGSADARRPSG